MIYTVEEKQKIHNALDQIKVYLEGLQPQLRGSIQIDFGPMHTYANYERERHYHLYISKDSISARIGGLGLDFDRESTSSSTRSTVYSQTEFATGLIQNWASIKAEIISKIAEQNATLESINNFQI